MSLSIFELALIRLTILVDHNSIADVVVFKPALKGRSVFESVKSIYLLIVLPLSPELISIGILISTSAISFAIFYFALVVLRL